MIKIIFLYYHLIPRVSKSCIRSLSRLRPVIIFKEISHVKSSFKGIFISKETLKLQKTIIFILNNYIKIQKSMKKNKIPTKLNFQTT